MPRPKLYANPSDKHAQYRRRRAEEYGKTKELSNSVEKIQEAHRHISQEQGVEMQTAWYALTIKADRPDMKKPAYLKYTISREELKVLQTDFEDFAQSTSSSDCATCDLYYGTYAVGNPGDGSDISGIVTLAFEGLTIAEIKALPEFTNPNGYDIPQGIVSLIRTQGLGA